MGKKELPRTLADLRKKGYVIPGIDKRGKATVPAMPATIECPDCGQRIPVFVQVQNLTFAVSYPIKKELVKRGLHNA